MAGAEYKVMSKPWSYPHEACSLQKETIFKQVNKEMDILNLQIVQSIMKVKGIGLW